MSYISQVTEKGTTVIKQVTERNSFNINKVKGVPWPSYRGVFGGGGNDDTYSDTMQYISIGHVGNTTDFGDLTAGRRGLASCASSTRGIFISGKDGSNTKNVMDYITILTTGNALDFGDHEGGKRRPGACSNETVGVIFCGWGTDDGYYITIASTGNSTFFAGDMMAYMDPWDALEGPAGCASTTKGFLSGGSDPTGGNMDDFYYITFASLGSGTRIGEMNSPSGDGIASCSGVGKGLVAGDTNAYNTIDYFSVVATSGNSTDFGDLTVGRKGLAACSSKLYAVFGGGWVEDGAYYNVMDYITIATTGNATDCGDLVATHRCLTACSNSHGGLA